MLDGNIHVQTVAAIAVATVGGFFAGNAEPMVTGAIATAPIALLAIMTVGAGLQESRLTLAGFALVAIAIVAALDSIRRFGLSDTGGASDP